MLVKPLLFKKRLLKIISQKNKNIYNSFEQSSKDYLKRDY